jgi:hypothetical protein
MQEDSAPVIDIPRHAVKASNSLYRLAVRCTPEIRDPSEIHNVLVSSIRSLFGELESHSFGVEVKPLMSLDSEIESQHHFTIVCEEESVDAIRASLTMATTYQFGGKTVYCFDVIE